MTAACDQQWLAAPVASQPVQCIYSAKEIAALKYQPRPQSGLTELFDSFYNNNQGHWQQENSFNSIWYP